MLAALPMDSSGSTGCIYEQWRRKMMRGLKIGALLLAVVTLVGLATMSPALAEDKPRRGGMLRVALAGDPPSLDMHQEQTFMVTIPMSPAYNTLVMFDPH